MSSHPVFSRRQLIASAALASAAPAAASVPQIPDDPASAYIAARAASISGAHADAGQPCELVHEILNRLGVRSHGRGL